MTIHCDEINYFLLIIIMTHTVKRTFYIQEICKYRSVKIPIILMVSLTARIHISVESPCLKVSIQKLCLFFNDSFS